MPASAGLKGGQTYPVMSDGPAQSPFSGKPVPDQLQQLAAKVLPVLEEQQSSLTTLFANLQAVSTQAANGQLEVPKPVQTAIEQILGLRLGSQSASSTPSGQTTQTSQTGVPDGSVLGAEDVQRAMELSGLFRELTLRTGGAKAAGGDDLKSLLMNLRKLLQSMGGEELPARPLTQPRVPSLRGSPQGQLPAQTNLPAHEDGPEALASRLLKDTDGALSRIRLEQLASRGINREAAGQQQGASTSQSGGGSSPAHASHAGGGRAMDLVVDLPLVVGGQTAVVQMQVGRDPDQNGDADSDQRAWRLRFALDLTATGPMEAAVSLRGGGTFVSLWADREEMHRALNENRETLEAAFAHAGLDLQELRFIRGLPARRRFAAGASVDRQS
ncbi:flagellar hook-length control protein FliK [Roseibium suaedae]|uniref:Hook-length control protein FliK n=1 Tax=Roseibium suaedae TaxID=735517 RepID=A0A1M7FFM4_9HYPH|nr:flagellar hook-length control protein FliK [Roseibium suaedae]SHM02912.1 hook-length control protein FliK [Roseibium suaedae]